MSSTMESFLAMAAMFPEDDLIEKTISALTEYKILKTKQAQLDASMYSQLFVTKMTINEKGLSKTISDVTELQNISQGIKNKGSN